MHSPYNLMCVCVVLYVHLVNPIVDTDQYIQFTHVCIMHAAVQFKWFHFVFLQQFAYVQIWNPKPIRTALSIKIMHFIWFIIAYPFYSVTWFWPISHQSFSLHEHNNNCNDFIVKRKNYETKIGNGCPNAGENGAVHFWFIACSEDNENVIFIFYQEWTWILLNDTFYLENHLIFFMKCRCLKWRQLFEFEYFGRKQKWTFDMSIQNEW